MKKQYKAKITYKIKPTHPDIESVKDWKPGKEFSYEDTYYIENEFDKEMIYDYIKSDLRLVAGGGYNSKHIYGERLEINGKEVY